jgi:RNA polymerase sigma factor (sigma-70 family)
VEGRATIDAVAAPTVEGPSDQQLVARVRRGDDRAFEGLYRRYHRRIYAYVVGMVKDHGRAEDVTQEVFVSALRRMRQTERPIAFKPWIYEIAKNACIDAFRRSRRAEEVSYDAEEGLAPHDYGKLVGSGPSPDEALDAKEDIAHLQGAFGGLSDMHHEILVMRELEGLSYRDIGDRLGLSRPAVESTLFRARKRLTEEYDELVSGARCLRIQAIIATAGAGDVGVRDSRRLARHVAHCQPCRRLAAGAGLDVAALAPATRRARVAAKVAGWLPFPIPFLRRPGGGGGAAMAQLAAAGGEPAATGWGKMAIAAATMVIAGVGAGVGEHAVRSQRDHAAGAASGGAAASRLVREAGRMPASKAVTTRSSATSTKRVVARRERTKTTRIRDRRIGGGNGGGTNAPAGGGGGNAPGGASGGGDTPATSSGGGNSGGGGPTTPKVPQLPSLPSGGGGSLPVQVPQDPVQTVNNTVNQVTQTVDQTVQQTTGTAGDTVDQVGDTADQVVPGAGGLLP